MEKYISVKLMPVVQKDNVFYVGKLKCRDLLKLYAVHPAEYDLKKQLSLRDNFSDDADYFNYLISESRASIDEIKDKGFQRTKTDNRTSDIVDFLEEKEFALFPNSIIASCDLLNDFVSDKELNENVLDLLSSGINLSFLEMLDDVAILHIPLTEKSLIIIDGQHRIEGLRLATDYIQDNFELLVSFILGYDRSILAQLFYTINYTQKSVNKSLLYHLTGEFSKDLDQITYLHEFVKVLNESQASPFYKRIKMIGKKDKTLAPEEQQLMTLSQAFLIDYLKYTIQIRDNYRDSHPIFLYYYKNKKGFLAVRFVMRYFMAVESLMPAQWSRPNSSILSKTLGVGALLKAMNFVFIKCFIDNALDDDPENIDLIKTATIKSTLDGIQNVDWDIYSKSSSAGQVNKLKRELLSKMSCFQDKADPQQSQDFQEKYIKPFTYWLSSSLRP
ncbi:DGQHR domain-containing protein [Desulfocurvibacter africanus]|uniref:DGQHR domain-containing protein n=1 Tax=Desulfocurvibacter africanus TaxID=873 RepID=UPI002FDB6FE8